MEKVMETHGISKAQKSTNPDLQNSQARQENPLAPG